MNQKYDRMSPNQRENARRSLAELLALAEETPARPSPRKPQDLLPLLHKLYNDKKLSWSDIADWLNANTEFDRSASFWLNLYKEHKTKEKTYDPSKS